MLTAPTRAQAASLFDGTVKVVALIGGVFVIIAGCWLVFSMPGGGVRFGTQVETDALAATSKAANAALEQRIAVVDEKATSIKATMEKIAEQLNQLSVITQRLNEHDRNIQQLSAAVGTLNDRINNVSKNTDDRMNQIADTASKLQGRLDSLSPPIQQPTRR